VIGYLSGSVMYSLLIPKLFYGLDVRRQDGDKNPGAFNAIHAVGAPVGAICLSLDMLKAFTPVFLAVSVAHVSGFSLIPVMLAPVLGHAFPLMFRFRGGKAISAAGGSLLGTLSISHAALVVISTMLFFQFICDIRPNSAKMIASFVISCILIVAFEPLMEMKAAMVLMSVLVCVKLAVNPNDGELSVKIWRMVFGRRSAHTDEESEAEDAYSGSAK